MNKNTENTKSWKKGHKHKFQFCLNLYLNHQDEYKNISHI